MSDARKMEIATVALNWMANLKIELQHFYRQLGRELNDRDLATEIEMRYGERIKDEVCIPNQLSQGACLLIAMEVAKQVSREESKPQVVQNSTDLPGPDSPIGPTKILLVGEY
jgi:hypothetical protein